MALVLLWLGPGRADAELPRAALPALGLRPWHVDLLAGSQDAGVSVYVSSHGYELQPKGLALEVTRGYRNGALNLWLAYHRQLSEVTQTSACSVCDLIVTLRQPFNVAMQLGFHGHTATRTEDAGGFGPAAGLSMSWSNEQPLETSGYGGLVEGFLGVQSAAVLTPAQVRLGMPLRVSAGIHGSWRRLVHLMLVGRAGWDDVWRDLGGRLAYDVTASVGFWGF